MSYFIRVHTTLLLFVILSYELFKVFFGLHSELFNDGVELL
jgi:hypothetical protein